MGGCGKGCGSNDGSMKGSVMANTTPALVPTRRWDGEEWREVICRELPLRCRVKGSHTEIRPAGKIDSFVH